MSWKSRLWRASLKISQWLLVEGNLQYPPLLPPDEVDAPPTGTIAWCASDTAGALDEAGGGSMPPLCTLPTAATASRVRLGPASSPVAYCTAGVQAAAAGYAPAPDCAFTACTAFNSSTCTACAAAACIACERHSGRCGVWEAEGPA